MILSIQYLGNVHLEAAVVGSNGLSGRIKQRVYITAHALVIGVSDKVLFYKLRFCGCVV